MSHPRPSHQREAGRRLAAGFRSAAQRSFLRACAYGLLLLPLLAPGEARGFEFIHGRLRLHGFAATRLRALSDGLRRDRWFVAQWAQVLDLEAELDLAPNGLGPFDSLMAFARAELRYDCVWTRLCGLFPSHTFFGDRAERVPRNLADGRRSALAGLARVDTPRPIHGAGARLLPFTDLPPLDRIRALGPTGFEATFEPVANALAAAKRLEGSIDEEILPLLPWNTGIRIEPIGSLRTVESKTFPLPLRPDPGSLSVPSPALRAEKARFGAFDQNFRGDELAWNHGAGQDEHELKELYLDVELLDSRLFLRLGKQIIVWGKTELFRVNDPFNPQDLALSSLPTLEESRLGLWAARAIYSLYDVGPLEDVRIEAVGILDDFEPADIGRCGEPFAAFLVCSKSSGLFLHGLTGAGLAGERRPPAPWRDASGLELGARVEFRWRRATFAISDFLGYQDFPVARLFGHYERRVDPDTGRPLDAFGRRLDPSLAGAGERALRFGAGNRQLFDLFCAASVGLAAGFGIPGLEDRCLLDLANAPTAAAFLGQVLAGTPTGEGLLQLLSGLPVDLVPLFAETGPALGLDSTLSPEQQALLGCGPFFGTSCDRDGIDLFHSEASVLLQSFPGFEPGGPVATRFVPGRGLVVLPGARSVDDPGYDPRVDGCVSPSIDGPAPPGTCSGSPDLPALGLRSELAALSRNFLDLLAALDIGTGRDPGCSLAEPIRCEFVQALLLITGVQRPEIRAGGNGRFGRRDFVWHGGGELRLEYAKRNWLGFAVDFAEDRTKTAWSVELAWKDDLPFFDARSSDWVRDRDVVELALSIDRPSFVRFVNRDRSIFVNTQWFLRWIARYPRRGGFSADGPLAVLGTLTIATGYFQDRLLPSLTLVHDWNSHSGGVTAQITHRATADFSITWGTALFYGRPRRLRIPDRPAALTNEGGSFKTVTRYEGLTPIAQRDEVFVILRYTF